MKSYDFQSLNVSKQGKDKQLEAVYNAFHQQPLTMKEVYVRTGVLREFVCWYCRTLRKSGQLYFIKIRKCSITGRYVKEFTTNEAFVPEFPKQLKLF